MVVIEKIPKPLSSLVAEETLEVHDWKERMAVPPTMEVAK
jgi:hypothetical protein